uniref:DNA replication factor RFC1 C-terminal domain-containing protein n=1 Tax=Megaviridae environmental sample TaxID=1737588 RepID=A0A5J6VI53_9VIRU|nr:MAG: hypothetical protein [Megaviridae environmental sample]
MQWVRKHAPKTFAEISGNVKNLKDLEGKFKDNPHMNFIIISKHSVGKTTIAELLLEKYNYNYKYYDSNTSSHETIIDELKNLNYNNLLMRLNNESSFCKKTALIIDNIDSITLTCQKNNVISIYQDNNKFKWFPIFIISNGTCKILDDIIKHSYNVLLNPMALTEMTSLANRISKSENITFQNKSLIKDVVLFCKGDIRYMINLLQDLSHINRNITTDIWHEYQLTTEHRKIDNSLYDSVRIMFKYADNLQRVEYQYNMEKVLIPLILADNYYKELFNRINSNSEILSLVMKISDYISQGDMIVSNIYTNQNWQLQKMHCFTSCIQPCHIISQNKYNKNTYDLSFSSELNKTSLKNINRKNINNIKNKIGLDLKSHLRISSILNHLIKLDQVEKIASILKSLTEQPDIKLLDSLIKIDKTNSTAKPISSKMRKRIQLCLL